MRAQGSAGGRAGIERKGTHGKARSIADPLQRRERYTWASPAQKDGSNKNMQPVEATRREKA